MAPSQEASTVTSAVTSLLSALDNVSASFVDRAEVLAVACRQEARRGAAVTGALEHGLAVLEALWTSTPRRGRRMIGTTVASGGAAGVHGRERSDLAALVV